MSRKIDGITFFDEGAQEGIPIVLVHGFPFNHDMWRPQIIALSSKYRVISYDVRGHGESEVGDGQYTVEYFVDDLWKVLDELKIQKAVLCGLSMGGYIVLRAAERNPERVLGLVLCDTKSEADGNEAKIKRAGAAQAVKKDGVAAFAAGFIKTVLTEKSLNDMPLMNSVLQMILSNKPAGIAGALLALACRTDTSEALAKINVPVLILVGEEDKLTPLSVSESMLKAMPHANLYAIPFAAHLSNLENPGVFNEKLLNYLSQF